ncbi:MAG: hypothetical protein Q8L20_10955 [Gammaproteobacteria bacterium]|nr:hypothetical protein [Gammaproteobacteria bacterium]
MDWKRRVKAAEKALLDLHAEAVSHLEAEHRAKKFAAERVFRRHDNNAEAAELQRFEKAEPFKWAAMGRTSIQIGVMELIRAISQQSS